MRRDERGPWYLLTGLVLGLLLGLAYAWAVQPREYTDTAPASLRADFKDQYRALIASAFTATGDLVRAKARLELLEDPDMFRALSEQAQRTLADGNSPDEARALGMLAIALGQNAPGPAIVITQQPPTITSLPTVTASLTARPVLTDTLEPSPTHTLAPTSTPTLETLTPQPTTQSPSPTPSPRWSSTPTETPRPRPTATPTRTPTLTITPSGPFVLLSRQRLCDQALDQPLLKIEATNALEQPVAGILVLITWPEGEERFYTGLMPEKGPGYADFTLVPGVTYTVSLGDGGEPVPDVTAVACQEGVNEQFWGAWLFTFTQK